MLYREWAAAITRQAATGPGLSLFSLQVSPSPHGGYITVTEKPDRASEQRAWAGF